jgi:hypothetical protein
VRFSFFAATSLNVETKSLGGIYVVCLTGVAHELDQIVTHYACAEYDAIFKLLSRLMRAVWELLFEVLSIPLCCLTAFSVCVCFYSH